ncbi:polysaccharide deacetylase family protein [Bacillus sp. JJ722]|uniref:polysaccharide deacetylase family protein n=1 Tax=Bacillus sp. JJ722 TaxID=3122973 RepID=UPI002FFF94EE
MKFKLVVLLLLATLLAVGCTEKTIGSKKYVKDSKYPEMEIETEIGEYDTYKYAIHFPRTKQEDVNNVIKKLVTEQKNGFITEAGKVKTKKDTYSELLLDYKITNLSDTLLSIVFTSNENIYGKDNSKKVYTLNFDRKTGKQIQLEDMLVDDSSLQKIARLSQNQILQDEKAMKVSDVSQVMDGTKPELNNFDAYSFSNNTMDIYLKEKQIGPKEMGTYKVQIALNDLNGVLEKSYIESLELKIPNETELLSNTTSGKDNQQTQSALTPGVKYVALTFDDGPHHQLTPRILDILKKYDAKATFYVLGNRVEYYPEIVKRAVDEGHEIGSHSWSHPKLTSLKPAELAQQINQTSNAVEKITGKAPATLRPPYGAVNDAVKKATNGPIVNWSVDTLDWEHRNKEKVIQTVKQNTRNGSIILMHDIQQATADALEDVLIYLSEQGYHFVTVSQLLQLGDHPEKYVGQVFTNG